MRLLVDRLVAVPSLKLAVLLVVALLMATPVGSSITFAANGGSACSGSSHMACVDGALAQPGPTHSLLYSQSSDRGDPSPLGGATLAGNVYVFLSPATPEIARVDFWLDNPAMSGSPRQSERTAPHDFAGGSVTAADPFRTTTLTDGPHTITSRLTLVDGDPIVVTASFVVHNAPAPPTPTPPPGPVEPGPPDQVHLSWTADPATTMTVVWRALDSAAPSDVRYRAAGATDWQSSTGTVRLSGTAGVLHEATLSGLAPGGAYEYQVMGNQGVWSDVFSFRTAPGAGPANFDLIYFADTGLIGRADGLAPGTEQVRDEIAALRPLLTLPGGDYIYYDTDKRYGSINDSIDAWFNQVQPIAAFSAMMPTYGNHETLLGEGLQHWQPRFAQPTGHNNGQSYYSFDIADVHFVSILAVEDNAGISNSALAWIDADMADARARGQRWIVPYFHAVPFGDGTNHHANPELREQFGPIFEAHDVKFALYSHDQAYERSFPLRGVPDAVVATSSSDRCYGADDGVTWVKTSPAGKLSNLNGRFSQFASDPPPSWTAFRNNTLHTFGRLSFSDDGGARFEAYGVTGDGDPPIVIDSFEYRLDSACPGELEFSQPDIVVDIDEGEATTTTADLQTSDGVAADATITEDATWLSVMPAALTTPAALTLSIDSTGLVPGVYQTNVTARSGTHIEDSLVVTLQVHGASHSYVSSSPDRSAPVRLDGQTVAGDIYVFTLPETSVNRVDFYLDKPGLSGTPRKTEGNAPFDFAGTATNGSAFPFDTTDISDGQHTVSARISLSDGTEQITHSTFTVANEGPVPPSLAVLPASVTFAAVEGEPPPAASSVDVSTNDGVSTSYTATSSASWLITPQQPGPTPDTFTVAIDSAGLTAGSYTGSVTVSSATHASTTIQVTLTVTGGGPPPDFSLLHSAASARTNPVALDGATLAGRVYIFSAPDTPEIDRVSFWLDNPAMSGSPRRTESTAPYDLAGGSASRADPFDTRSLSDGGHTLTARIFFLDGTSATVSATFTVDN